MTKTSSRFWLPLLFSLLLLALWQFLSARLRIAFWVLPSPGAVFGVFRENPALLWSHIRPTLFASVAGLLLATLLGVVTAMAMHSSKPLKQIFYPYLVVSQTVPQVAVAPLVVLWFGYGISAKIFVVVLMCFFPVALGLFDGLRQVSQEQLRLLRSMGASRWQTYRYLKIPASLPAFFTGLKLAATYSVMGAVVGEWLGGQAGLGIYLTRSTKSFRTEQVFAAILLIILLSLALFGLVSLFDRLLLGWHYKKLDEYEDTSL